MLTLLTLHHLHFTLVVLWCSCSQLVIFLIIPLQLLLAKGAINRTASFSGAPTSNFASGIKPF